MPNRDRETAFFHDQKSEGFFEGLRINVGNKKDDGTTILDVVGSDERPVRLHVDSRHHSLREIFDLTPEQKEQQVEEVRLLRDVIGKIHGARLIVDQKGNEGQEALLAKRKDVALNMIREVLQAISSYLSLVRKNVNAQRIFLGGESEEALEDRVIFDRVREHKHSALVDDVRIAVRYIAHTFGDIDRVAIEKWNDQFEARDQEKLFVERQKFARNVICPDYINLGKRRDVAAWAMRIFDEVAHLASELEK